MPLPTLPLIATLASLAAILAAGSLLRLIGLRAAPPQERKSRLASLATWWVLLIAVSLAAFLGPWGIAIFLLIASLLSLAEFTQILDAHLIGVPAKAIYYASPVLLLILTAANKWPTAHLAAPIIFVIALGVARTLQARTENYLKLTAGLFWAFFLFAYSPSFALRTVLDAEKIPPAGPAGWFIYATIMTELNDISQALIGRKWGLTKITPRVSPNKSLEGLLGGIAGSAIFGIALAPTLTSFFQNRSLVAGIAISATTGVILSLAGFLGDLNVSSIKRDAGVKDIGNFVPGQGGALDRMNSFSYVAPVFYFWVVWVLQA